MASNIWMIMKDELIWTRKEEAVVHFKEI